MRIKSAWSNFYGRAHDVLNRRSPLGEHLQYLWQHRVTPSGRVLLLVLLVVGPVSSTSIYIPLYWYAIFIFSMILAARVAGLIFFPRVTVTRKLPERCAAGANLEIRAVINNTGRLPVFDIAAGESRTPPEFTQEESPRYLDCLEAGMSHEMHYNLTVTKRGVYDLKGPAAMTVFPFGIYNHTKKFPAPHRMIVYPRFHALDDLALPAGRRHHPGGLQLTSRVGDSEEFHGNREYRPGDRLRDIDHAAWGRVGFPVVREFQQEYLSRIALVVDTFVPRKSKQGSRAFEAGLSMGAAVADALSRQEYVVDLFAAGPELYHFQAGRSLAYLDNILDILACIQECRANPFEKLSPAIMEEIKQISTAVVILLDWDETRHTLVKTMQDCGVAVKVIIVRDGATTFEPTGVFGESGPVKQFTPEQVEKGIDRL